MRNNSVQRGKELYELLNSIDNFLKEVDAKENFRYGSWSSICHKLSLKLEQSLTLSDLITTAKPEKKFFNALVSFIKNFRKDVVEEIKTINKQL